MIGYFPAAYPDELLYSVCARCFDRMCYPGKQSIVQELFGTRTILACIELPSHLDKLVAALPAGHHYSADQLIDYHTLFPFYGPFLPPARLQRIRQDMHGSDEPTIHMRAGIMASHVPLPRWLRCCSLCVQEDEEVYGECYWHRIHQVPGVEVCPFHKVYLQNSNILAQNRETRYEFVSAKRAIPQMVLQEPVSIDLNHEVLLSVALDALWLLRQHHLSQGPQSLYRRYSQLLTGLDLATYKGRVFISEFQQKFRSYYSPDILEILGCKIDERVNENWLVRLVRKSDNAQHPLHHMLLIHFLGHSVETFFNIPCASRPFGEGPWPCLNSASNHYQQYQIQHCQVDYSQYVHSRPVGTFSCACGFIYSRIGPDTSPKDCYKFSRVKSFGGIWEERLQLLWGDETVSLRGIAKQLGVDPLTVKRHATRIGLLFPRPGGTCLPLKEAQQLRGCNSHIPEPDTVENCRSAWLAALEAEPEDSLMRLRQKAPKIYSWLYRNDKAWLEGNRPLRKSRGHLHFTPVDWESRDIQIASDVQSAVTRLKVKQGRPKQITLSAIGRDIGQLALLQQHLDRLPLSARLLAESVETREEFAVRRVQWVVEQCLQEETNPSRWTLIKRAGVERIAAYPAVHNATEIGLRVLSDTGKSPQTHGVQT